MRLVVCTLSAVLLSGCSWLGGALGSGHSGQNAHSAYQSGRYFAGDKRRGHQQKLRQQDPCQIFSPQQPIPQGCNPSQVTLGTAGGFPQQPNFGGGYGHEYASQGFGSHADQQAAHYQPKGKIRKPRWRGSLSLGLEKSNSGDLLDFSAVDSLDPANPFSGLDPFTNYNPQDFNQTVIVGTPATGNVTTTTFTANAENQTGTGTDPLVPSIFTDGVANRFDASSISFDDVHSTPLRIAGGAEFILTPRATLFANAGYSYAEGKSGDVASVNASVYRLVSSENFDAAGTSLGPAVETLSELEPQEIARFNYDFTDLRRIDLEAGGRYYFNPINKNQGYKTLTPFVGASAGVSHFNSVSYDFSLAQTNYAAAFAGNPEPEISAGPRSRVELYDSQWVPSGQLNAGMEWQVTPKTALALETGVRIEGARDYSNGVKGDTNVAIPVTLRGSFNF